MRSLRAHYTFTRTPYDLLLHSLSGYILTVAPDLVLYGSALKYGVVAHGGCKGSLLGTYTANDTSLLTRVTFTKVKNIVQ